MLDRLKDSPVVRRIASGTGANLLGKLWVFASQIVMIPLLTQYWGVEGYGLWLLISTVPAYVQLGDIGIAPTLAPSLSEALARGDLAAASNLLRTGWVLQTLLVVAIAALAGGVGWVIAATDVWASSGGEGSALGAAIMLMALYAVAIAQMKLVNAIYRATYRYAIGTIAIDAMVLAELVALCLAVSAGAGLAFAALTLLVTRIIGLIFYYRHAVRLESWASITKGSFSRLALGKVLHPSLAAFAVTIANTLIFHALIAVLGFVSGPATVALFGATRVLTRAPLQFASLLSRAAVPELTRASLNGNISTMRRLVWISVGTALLVSVPSSLFIVFAGPSVLLILTGSSLSPPLVLIAVLSLAATLSAAWSSGSVLLVAQNKLAAFSYAYAAMSVAGVLATLLAPRSGAALVAAGGMAAAEGVALGAVVLATRAALSKAHSV